MSEECGTIEKTQPSAEELSSHLEPAELRSVALLSEWHAAPFGWPCVLWPAAQLPQEALTPWGASALRRTKRRFAMVT